MKEKQKVNRYMNEIDAYRYWKWICNTKISFGEFKENLLKAGYVIYTIESEGNSR